MEKNAKIFIAGHKGLVGSALIRKLSADGFSNLILRERAELNLLDKKAVESFFEMEKPNYVFLAAAKVGGIMANKLKKADFIYENLEIQNNVIHSAWKFGVKKLLFLGSSCIYPKNCPQPIREEYLMSGYLEETNAAYAVAKIAGIKMCQSFNEQYDTNFISVMPTNLYGENDNFHLENSHVIPAMIRKFHDAKTAQAPTVTLWGTGTAMREFLHVDDMAAACLHVLGLSKEHYQACTEPMLSHLNVGTGTDVTIRELAETIQQVVGFKGDIIWDSSKPDGAPRKLMDVSKIKSLDWQPQITLTDGLASTYRWFVEHHGEIKAQ